MPKFEINSKVLLDAENPEAAHAMVQHALQGMQVTQCTVSPVQVEICYDECSHMDNPCDWGAFKVVSFSNRHVNYMHPDQAKQEYSEALQDGRAFMLDYFEHGQCKWSLAGEGPQCQWDNVRFAGILVCTDDAMDLEDMDTAARGFLEAYTQWCNGSIYAVSVDALDEACGGFYSTEAIQDYLNEIDCPENRQYVGNAAYIME